MPEGFDLGSYLQQVRSEGVQDSEGSFTVAQDKALDKLARFTLPREYDWVLKIVQAAYAWNCPLLQVSQTRVATSFYFCPPADSFPRESSIVEALRVGSTPEDGPLHDLCIALRALVDQVGLSFVLAIRRNEEPGSPIYSGDDVSGLGEKERLEWASLTTNGLRLTVSHLKGNESTVGRYVPTFTLVARRNIGIAEVLQERAFCSSMPIYLDGRLLTNPFTHPKIGEKHFSRPLALACSGKSEDPIWIRFFPALTPTRQLTSPKQLLSHDTDWALFRTYDWSALRKVKLAQEQGDEYSYYVYRAEFENRIFWVRNGVVCMVDRVDSKAYGTCALLFVNVNDARTDLSGLQLQIAEQERVRLSQLCGKLASVLPEIDKLKPLLTSPGAALDPLVSDSRTHLPTLQDLSVGSSVFTESLLPRYNSPPLLDQASRLWRNLIGLPWRKQWLENWYQQVKVDVRTLATTFLKANTLES